VRALTFTLFLWRKGKWVVLGEGLDLYPFLWYKDKWVAGMRDLTFTHFCGIRTSGWSSVRNPTFTLFRRRLSLSLSEGLLPFFSRL
jgi:hypothetical protein